MPSTAGKPLPTGSGNLMLTTPLIPAAVIELFTAKANACGEPDGAADNSGRATLPVIESIRVRDDDLDPDMYDLLTGEYFDPPKPAPRSQGIAADSWVANVLATRSTQANLAGRATVRRGRS